MLAQPRRPRLIAFTASDPDNGDGDLSRGDTLTLTFDQRAQPPADPALPPRGGGAVSFVFFPKRHLVLGDTTKDQRES